MALNILAHWSLNEPSENPIRVWDNSGNGHHGDFGQNKPIVVMDSPCGSRSMEWPSTGASVVLPEFDERSGLAAISYWMKDDGIWNLYIFSDGKKYINLMEEGSVSVSKAESDLRNNLQNNRGHEIYYSDIYYYGAILSVADMERIYHVKATVSSNNTLNCKEYMEASGSISKVSVGKVGKVSANNLTVQTGSVGFNSEGKIHAENIVEY